MYYITVIPQ